MWYRTLPFLSLQGAELPRTTASLDELRRRVDRMFDDMGWGDADANDRAMAQALEDTGKTLMLRADMPGVKERDVTLTLQRNVLSLTVRRGIERPEGFRAHRQERAEFERTWTLPLPARVDPDKVKATLADGQLCVVMEKALEDQPRHVPVHVA